MNYFNKDNSIAVVSRLTTCMYILVVFCYNLNLLYICHLLEHICYNDGCHLRRYRYAHLRRYRYAHLRRYRYAHLRRYRYAQKDTRKSQTKITSQLASIPIVVDKMHMTPGARKL